MTCEDITKNYRRKWQLQLLGVYLPKEDNIYNANTLLKHVHMEGDDDNENNNNSYN